MGRLRTRIARVLTLRRLGIALGVVIVAVIAVLSSAGGDPIGLAWLLTLGIGGGIAALVWQSALFVLRRNRRRMTSLAGTFPGAAVVSSFATRTFSRQFRVVSAHINDVEVSLSGFFTFVIEASGVAFYVGSTQPRLVLMVPATMIVSVDRSGGFGLDGTPLPEIALVIGEGQLPLTIRVSHVSVRPTIERIREILA